MSTLCGSAGSPRTADEPHGVGDHDLALERKPQPLADRIEGREQLVLGERVPVGQRVEQGRLAGVGAYSLAWPHSRGSAFHVMTAEDGAPAISLAETTAPDLALVDFEMPTPGIVVVKRLNELRSTSTRRCSRAADRRR